MNWTSPFPILGVSGVLFWFYYILNRNSCKQTEFALDQMPRMLTGHEMIAFCFQYIKNDLIHYKLL